MSMIRRAATAGTPRPSSFSAEMFDFGRENYNPHGKLTARYYFSPSVFITGGWDDFLNTKSNSDSVFVGAGVRWGDDAIKYLAGTAASATH